MKSSSSSRAPSSSEPVPPTEEQIRTRAYELYVESGRQDGQDTEHWLRAEKQLREKPVLLDLDAVPAAEEKSPSFDSNAGRHLRPLNERDYPAARGKRGSASRDEIRAQQVHPAARKTR